MAGTEKQCHPKREKLNIHTILFNAHMLYTITPSLNFVVSTKQKRTRREISTTTSCRPDNIRGTLTRGRVSSYSIVVVAGYLAVLLSIVTLALYDSNTNQLPSIPLLLFSSNVGPILVHARMTNPRYKEDDQNNSNESDSSKSDENEGNSYDRPPSPKQRNNRKPRTRRNRQQRDHTRFFNNPDEFQNRNSHQQNQQQQRNNQRRLNPFEIFSRFLLQDDDRTTTTTTTKRKKLLSLFPTHKPRHIVDGITTLVRSVFVGIGLGLVSLISVPVAEFLRLQQEQQQELYKDSTIDRTSNTKSRWVGLFVGGINGALFGSTFVVVGFVNGFYQAMRGMIHTPVAIQAIRKGMIWDINREKWKLYYLTEELDELESFQPFQDESRSVKDLAFYDMLDIETCADVKAIKRAYHRKARAVHPDKNLGNQSAADEFRRLHTAYLTLSDTDKRIAYDRWGRSNEKGDNGGTDEAPGIADFDPNVFFTILLNAKPVEQYIGNSTLASFTKQSMQLWRSGNGNSLEDVIRLFWNDNQSSQQNRRRRHVNIALYLNEKVSAYVNGDVSITEFQKRCRQEAIKIARAPFGIKYLSILGEVLNLEADKYTIANTKLFGKLLSGMISIRNKLSAVKSTGAVMREIVNTAKFVKENEMTIVDEAALIQLLLPVMFEIGWMFHEADIQHAIHRACRKLFADASVDSRSKRLIRAETIRILAKEFLIVVQQEMERTNQSSTLLSSDDLSARIEVAAEISVMKASGFDLPIDIEARIQMARARKL